MDPIDPMSVRPKALTYNSQQLGYEHTRLASQSLDSTILFKSIEMQEAGNSHLLASNLVYVGAFWCVVV